MLHPQLRKLLEDRAASADVEARGKIDHQIRERFERRRAILISDMSGFSRQTEQHGVLHFLERIHRMQQIAIQITTDHRAIVCKLDADNVFAGFDAPLQAIEAALALRAACAGEDIVVSLGIGWGDVLDLDGSDLFGHEVNLASKLGEDIATRGEVLLTASAWEALSDQAWQAEPRHAVISGLQVAHYCLVDL